MGNFFPGECLRLITVCGKWAAIRHFPDTVAAHRLIVLDFGEERHAA